MKLLRDLAIKYEDYIKWTCIVALGGAVLLLYMLALCIFLNTGNYSTNF